MKEGDVTFILQRIGQGDPHAAEELLPVVYDELRRLAAASAAASSTGEPLERTALVHEAWLRLGQDAEPAWTDRAHFFAAAAEAIRLIVAERARSGTSCEPAPDGPDAEALLLDQALEAFAALEPQIAELVKLKYFAGLSLEETASLLGISPVKAARAWAYARAWLFNEINRLRTGSLSPATTCS